MKAWCARRPLGRTAVALAAVGLVLGLAGSADALKICAKKTKKGALKGLTLGEPECPRNRPEVVLDLTGQLGGLTGRLDEVGGRVDGLGNRMDVVQLTTLGAVCDGETARVLAPSGDLLDVQTVEEESKQGCRAFDGNQAGCDTAFELADAGPASCFYLNGKCRACDFQEHGAGACLNKCDPDQPQACASGARSRFAGDECFQILDQATCDASWIDGGERLPVACRWTAFTVPPGAPPQGRCDTTFGQDNTCGPVVPPVTCGTRRIVQDPASGSFGFCNGVEIEADCNASAQRDAFDQDQDGSRDDAVPCYYFKRPNDTTGTCQPCSYEDELRGRCANACP